MGHFAHLVSHSKLILHQLLHLILQLLLSLRLHLVLQLLRPHLRLFPLLLVLLCFPSFLFNIVLSQLQGTLVPLLSLLNDLVESLDLGHRVGLRVLPSPHMPLHVVPQGGRLLQRLLRLLNGQTQVVVEHLEHFVCFRHFHALSDIAMHPQLGLLVQTLGHQVIIKTLVVLRVPLSMPRFFIIRKRLVNTFGLVL